MNYLLSFCHLLSSVAVRSVFGTSFWSSTFASCILYYYYVHRRAFAIACCLLLPDRTSLRCTAAFVHDEAGVGDRDCSRRYICCVENIVHLQSVIVDGMVEKSSRGNVGAGAEARGGGRVAASVVAGRHSCGAGGRPVAEIKYGVAAHTWPCVSSVCALRMSPVAGFCHHVGDQHFTITLFDRPAPAAYVIVPMAAAHGAFLLLSRQYVTTNKPAAYIIVFCCHCDIVVITSRGFCCRL